MTRKEIANELRDLNYNLGVLERTEVNSISGAKDMMKKYQKVVRDMATIVAGIFELLPVIPDATDV